MYIGRSVLALEVIAATNLPNVPSIRMPTGHYVIVSTSNGQWNTTTKATAPDCSVSWNETFTIHGRPLMFSPCFMPIFSRKSKAIHLELHASYESGPSECVGTFQTTFGQVLVNDVQTVSCPAAGNQYMSLTLKAQRIKTTQPVDHAAGGAAESVASDQPMHPPATVRSIKITGQLPHAPSDDRETSLYGRNIVVFGEAGAGKSSVINAIAQKQLAKTSNDAHGCTATAQRYPVEISGQKFVLFDTAGLGEGSPGAVPDAEAKRQLKNLLCRLMSSTSPSGGIDLLVYCVSSTTARNAIIRAYDMFYSKVCKKKVPIVIVITRLEDETNMESWWDKNSGRFKSMHFAGHACVTALQEYPGIPDGHIRRIAESSDTLRNLLLNNCSHYAANDRPNCIAGLSCASSWSRD
ncbi:P-loop containing nucleoside triphosphate hydrolase protein [Suillus hirtellus]|nr:P-loop containing nucleoside triphosphate hydrolase protein [Suillus hirtellus]